MRQLFSLLQIPVEATWCAADIMSSEDPLFVGRPGSLAARGANFALQNCDFLLSIGARLDFAITGYRARKLARAAHKVMVDIDAAEIEKLAPYIHTPNLRRRWRVPARNAAPDRIHRSPRTAAAGSSDARTGRTRYPVVLAEHRKPEGRVSIYHLAEVIGRGDHARRHDDLRQFRQWHRDLPVRLPDSARASAFITPPGWAPWGTAARQHRGLPGRGRARTICVDGDGGFQFNIQELETVARLNLPIKFFVLNNNGYASIRASQANFFGAPQIGCDARHRADRSGSMQSRRCLRLGTARIAGQENLRDEVRRVLEMPGPVVCDVQVIPDEVRGPAAVFHAKARRIDGFQAA